VRCRSHSDSGAVTVELALALPVLFATVAAAVWALVAAGAQLACVDAARAGARAAARGEPSGTVTALALADAPRGARVEVSSTAGLVTVRVLARSRPLGLALPGLPVHGTATARLETDPAPPP
jgi:Flp pilus assembly protein TadG